VPKKHTKAIKAVIGRLLINRKPLMAGANIRTALRADNEWRYQIKELALALMRT
jgi:hypothetical protein